MHVYKKTCSLLNAYYIHSLVQSQRQLEDVYASCIRRCTSLRELKRVEGEIYASGFTSNRYLTNILLQMYGHFGSVHEARTAFEKMHNRNAHTWNFIMVAYAQNGHLHEARVVFEKLPARSDVTWNTMMSSYAQNGRLDEAKELFDMFPERDLVSRNILVTAYAQNKDLKKAKEMFDTIPVGDLNVISWNNMLSAYAQNGYINEAKAIFERIPDRITATWNAMIAGLVQNGAFHAAVHLFRTMNHEGSRPNRITFTCVADACAGVEDAAEGRAVYAFCTAANELDTMVSNTFVNMFTRCGSLEDAKVAYDGMVGKSAIASTSMANAYAQAGLTREARDVFEETPDRDVVLWTTMIAAYSNNGEFEEAEKLFLLMPAHDDLAWSTIVFAYATNGHVEKAREFHLMRPGRDVSSWTGLITGHARAGHSRKALELFKLMDLEGHDGDKLTYVSVLEACATATALVDGRCIYSELVLRSWEKDTFVGTALLNMFAKCGRLSEARSVFEGISEPNFVSWTSVIVAYARSGERALAAKMFGLMELVGENPNWVTFSTVLAACSHGGLLEDARTYFLRMVGDYGIVPVVEHYRCVVDLLGRAGQLEKMEDLAESMPFEGDEVVWTAVLGACNIHGDAQRAARVAKKLARMKIERGSGLYVLLANLYTTTDSDEGHFGNC